MDVAFGTAPGNPDANQGPKQVKVPRVPSLSSSLTAGMIRPTLNMPSGMVDAGWTPMSNDDLLEYEEQAAVYTRTLAPILSIRYKSTDHGRNSVANVLKYLTGVSKQKLIRRIRPHGATDEDIKNGFLYGSTAYTRALDEKIPKWQTNSKLFPKNEDKRSYPTIRFETDLTRYIMVYILQARDIRVLTYGDQLDNVQEDEEVDIDGINLHDD